MRGAPVTTRPMSKGREADVTPPEDWGAAIGQGLQERARDTVARATATQHARAHLSDLVARTGDAWLARLVLATESGIARLNLTLGRPVVRFPSMAGARGVCMRVDGWDSSVSVLPDWAAGDTSPGIQVSARHRGAG